MTLRVVERLRYPQGSNHERMQMKPTPVAMVSVLVISLTGCGRFPAENKAPEKCGEAVCVDTPKFICVIASRTMTVLFSVRAQSGKQGAAPTPSVAHPTPLP